MTFNAVLSVMILECLQPRKAKAIPSKATTIADQIPVIPYAHGNKLTGIRNKE